MVKTEIQIRFADIDMLGHINNITLQSYYDTGKMEFFINVLGFNLPWQKEAFIVANTSTDYFEEFRPGNPFHLTTQISHLGTKSITFTQELIDSTTLKVKSRSKSVLVAFDLSSRQSVVIDDNTRANIIAAMGEEA